MIQIDDTEKPATDADPQPNDQNLAQPPKPEPLAMGIGKKQVSFFSTYDDHLVSGSKSCQSRKRLAGLIYEH